MKKELGLAIAAVCWLPFGLVWAEANDPSASTFAEMRSFRAPAAQVREHVPGFLWLEAEAFADYGGWSLDTQFTHKMGSAYLLAAGVMQPLAPATTTVEIPRAGTWRVWARTKDWLPDFSPGKFAVSVAGVRGAVLGASRKEGWRWEQAGDFTLAAGKTVVRLEDLSGAFARCDALLFTTDLAFVPPNEAKSLRAARLTYTGTVEKIADGGTYDLVVVGAGPGGLGTAFAAARNGARVLLVHDRPVMGGNAGCEMGVWMEGAGVYGRGNLRESGLVCEATMRRNRRPGWTYSDAFREMAAELKDRLVEVPNTRVLVVEKDGDKIAAVVGRSTLTGAETRFRGRLFMDGTGDGWIGYFAGAEYMCGREAKSEFNEAAAPEARDDLMMSGCIMDNCLGYRYRHTGKPQPYTTPEWARVLPPGFTRRIHRLESEWWVEHGGRFDELADPERARDELVRINFAYWGWIKNESRLKGRASDAVLTQMPYKNARREGFRLVGDYVLTANDALAGRIFPDRISYGGWPLDTHDPLGMENPNGNGYWKYHPVVPAYSIPYRCLYSKNVPNLLLGGRAVSVTHIALGSVRVQGTLFQLGQAAGTAAALMCEKNLMPREYGQSYIAELQQRLLKDDQYILKLKNEDSADLARMAKVTSSSGGRRHVFDARDPSLRRADGLKHDCSGCRRIVCFDRGELRRLEAVSLRLVNAQAKARELTINVYETDSNHVGPTVNPVATMKGTIPAGGRDLVRFTPAAPLTLTKRFVWVEMPVTKDVFWALREGTTGPADLRGWGFGNKWTLRVGEEYAFVTEPVLERVNVDDAAAVIDGVARPEGGVYHGWHSDPSLKLPQSVRLDFARPVTAKEVRLTFDPELSARHAAVRPPRLVKAYKVEALVSGQWQTLVTVDDNELRHRVHQFPETELTALRVTVNATWGDPSARIFEIRLYGTSSQYGLTETKLRKMRMPEIFPAAPATMGDLVAFLQQATIDYGDPTLPKEKRGVKFVCSDAASRKVFPERPKTTQPQIESLSGASVSIWDALHEGCRKAGCVAIVENGEVRVNLQ